MTIELYPNHDPPEYYVHYYPSALNLAQPTCYDEITGPSNELSLVSIYGVTVSQLVEEEYKASE